MRLKVGGKGLIWKTFAIYYLQEIHWVSLGLTKKFS